MHNNKMVAFTLTWMIISSLAAGVGVALVMRMSNPKADFYRNKDGTLNDVKFVMIGGIVAGVMLLLEAVTWMMINIDRKRKGKALEATGKTMQQSFY